MKTLLFALGLVSFVIYRAEKFHVTLHGTWEYNIPTPEQSPDKRMMDIAYNNIQLYRSIKNPAITARLLYSKQSPHDFLNNPVLKIRGF